MAYMYTKSEQRFITWLTITLIALFLLILAGGVVRSTGSGMGCPDWPKCFGQYVPPTDVSELPADYKEVYSHRGFANMDFNVWKTWTEYINRLIGAITGFLLFLTLFYSRTYLKTNAKIFWLTFLSFILTGFQAWVGAKVVQTNLKAYVVTIHMLIALVILALLIYVWIVAKKKEWEQLPKTSAKYVWLSAIIVLFCVIQIVLGTEVRERLDALAADGSLTRLNWLEQAGDILTWHKTWGTLLSFITIGLVNVLRKESGRGNLLYRVALISVVLVLIQLFIGFTLTQWVLPPVSQALHIFVATLLFGAQFAFMLLLFQKRVNN